MTTQEIKKWAKEKVHGIRWEILLVLLVGGFLTNLTISYGSENKWSIPLGWLFCFVEVGLTYYMIKFIKDEPHQFSDLFSFKDDFAKDLVVGLVRNIFIFLWTLVFIIPGIIKALSYTLVPFLLMDDKYKNMNATDLLKKSEEIMMGHKADYFSLMFSFIGWHLLAILTLGILEIWIFPYQETALIKFLYDVLNDYEKQNGISDNQNTTQDAKTNFCPNCGAKVQENSSFCASCGQSI